MAQLKDLIVNGATRLVGKLFATDIQTTTINGQNVGNTPKFTDTTYSDATTTTKGLMTAADKTKLNSIATGATANTGTVTSVEIKMNNSSKGKVETSGMIDLGTVITAHQSASAVNGTNIGSTTKGVYINESGKPTAMTYSLNKDVPSNAKFTDTVTTVTTTGSGNVITALTASNGAITATKGTTFQQLITTNDYITDAELEEIVDSDIFYQGEVN